MPLKDNPRTVDAAFEPSHHRRLDIGKQRTKDFFATVAEEQKSQGTQPKSALEVLEVFLLCFLAPDIWINALRAHNCG